MNIILKHILPDDVKVSITIDDIGIKSNLKNNQTLNFTYKKFYSTILGFPQSHSYPLDDNDGFYQLIAGLYKKDKPNNNTGIDKVHSKRDCVTVSLINSNRESILSSFAFSSPPGHKIYKEPRIKLFKKINKPVLSHITFYLEEDDHRPVEFNGETISFSCQLIKV